MEVVVEYLVECEGEVGELYEIEVGECILE